MITDLPPLQHQRQKIMHPRKMSREARLWNKTNGRCYLCGFPLHPFRTYTLDHVLPRDRGGGDTFDNLFPCCPDCNIEKDNMTIEEYRRYLEELPLRDKEIRWLLQLGASPQSSRILFYFERQSTTQPQTQTARWAENNETMQDVMAEVREAS